MHQTRPMSVTSQNTCSMSPCSSTSSQTSKPSSSSLPSSSPSTSASSSSSSAAAPSTSVTSKNEIYLSQAYRVAMLAMDTLLRRIHDDRPTSKFTRSNPHDKDIRWTLNVAQLMGSLDVRAHYPHHTTILQHTLLDNFTLYCI